MTKKKYKNAILILAGEIKSLSKNFYLKEYYLNIMMVIISIIYKVVQISFLNLIQFMVVRLHQLSLQELS